MATDGLIRVHGFPRSGNHLLMEMLARNFYPEADLETPGGEVGHWSDRQTVGPVEFGKLAGHHGPPDWGIVQPAIYVYRDGRAVMASLYNSPHFKHAYYPQTFAEYIRACLDWIWSPALANAIGITPIQHWKEHLELWDGAGALRIRYEHLVKHPVAMLERIQGRFGLSRPKAWVVPKRLVGHFPSGGALDGWRETWTAEDEEFFFSVVPKHFYGVYRDGE